jgi:hypothetical protein
MRLNLIKSVAVLIMLFIFNYAQAASSLATDFVKSFYVDLQKAEAVSSLDRIPKLQNYFDPKLYQLLLNDDANRAKNTDHMCGFLGFDAFGNFREDQDSTVKAEITQTNPTVLVDVTLPGTELPSLTMELQNENHAWKIVNITYPTSTPGDGGLAGRLAALQKVNCAAAS